MAQAPYWNGVPPPPPTLDVDQVLADSEADIQNNPPRVAGFAAYSLYYGLNNLTYEGGAGMSGNNSNLPAMVAANSDPRMGGQVSESLVDLFVNLGDMYMYYNDAGTYGRYGMSGTMHCLRPKHSEAAGNRSDDQPAVHADRQRPRTFGHPRRELPDRARQHRYCLEPRTGPNARQTNIVWAMRFRKTVARQGGSKLHRDLLFGLL